MRISITGATGFVGTNLQNYLKTSHEINSMSVRYVPRQQFEFNGNAIIHLAGKAHDLKKVSQPQEYYEANYELTKQLFDAFLKSEASVFIFMSTVKAVADEVKGVLSEDKIPNPKTHYGIVKQMAEKYILGQKIPDGKRVYILRPCMIHGPGNKGNLNLLYQFVAKGIPWPLGAFDNKRSFLSMDNLCFIVKELLRNENIPSGIYHLADDEVVSTNELIKILGESLGRKSKIWKINSSLIKLVSKMGDYLHLPLNSERLQKLTSDYVVSNRKILLAIGERLPVTTEQGLTMTFESFTK